MDWSTVPEMMRKLLWGHMFCGEDQLGWPESMFAAIYRARVLFSAQNDLSKISSLLLKENNYLFEKDIWKMIIVDLYTTKSIGILYFINWNTVRPSSLTCLQMIVISVGINHCNQIVTIGLALFVTSW